HRVDRKLTSREICATELPVPEMPGDEDQSPAPGQTLLDDAPAVDRLEQVDDLAPAVRRQDRRLDAGASQMAIGFTRHLGDVLRRPIRKGRRKLAFDHGPPNAERTIPEPA